MNEALLHHIWKFRLYSPDNLILTDGQLLTVEKPGHLNTDQGPDFTDARLKIGALRWAGNVEVHVKSSDWDRHAHTGDPAYGKIILHVVYQEDKKLFFPNGEPIPTLVLKERIDPGLVKRYRIFQNKEQNPACSGHLKDIPEMKRTNWMDRMAIEKLEEKTDQISGLLKTHKGNWEAAFYAFLFRSFGFHINSSAQEALAASIPISVLRKCMQNRRKTEALLFGQSGLLPAAAPRDAYTQGLWDEYQFIQQKHNLRPIEGSLWKFMRTRPSNFPALRISQLASLLSAPGFGFSVSMQMKRPDEIRTMLKVSAAEYWQDHVHFGKASTRIKITLGEASQRLILINALLPFLYSWHRHKGSEHAGTLALDLMAACAGEKNSILRLFETGGIPIRSALESQALLHLHKEYCQPKKCLECGFGMEILKR